MNIKNLTPHPISIHLTNSNNRKESIFIPPSGIVARVSTTPGTSRAEQWGIGIEEGEGLVTVAESPTYGAVEGLPEPVDGIVYIVSGMVLAHCKGRVDVFGPGTGPQDGAVRDEKGNVVAVTRLIRAPQ